MSFLLRIAHNRALKKENISMETLLYEQVEQLSKQIIRTKELDEPDNATAGSGPVGSMFHARAHRLARAQMFGMQLPNLTF